MINNPSNKLNLSWTSVSLIMHYIYYWFGCSLGFTGMSETPPSFGKLKEWDTSRLSKHTIEFIRDYQEMKAKILSGKLLQSGTNQITATVRSLPTIGLLRNLFPKSSNMWLQQWNCYISLQARKRQLSSTSHYRKTHLHHYWTVGLICLTGLSQFSRFTRIERR